MSSVRALVVVALSWALVLPMIAAPLLVDERVMAFEALKWLSLDPWASWSQPLGGSGTWRPLLLPLYRLDATASPFVRHAVNIGLYSALCLGVLTWLRGRVGPGAALGGAAWFAVHGAHVAVAGWVGGRADLTMVLCAVVALIAWDRGRTAVAVGAVVGAVLFKETAVALPAVLTLLCDSRRSRGAWIALWLGALVPFAVSVGIQSVDPAYLPGIAAWLRAAPYWPLFALEALVPTFRPLGALRGSDLVGLGVALGIGAWLWRAGLVDASSRRPLLAAAVAVAPVLHVLPNDGGQWYLLLPTLALAPLWARAVGASPRLGSAAIAGFLAVGIVWSTQWADASRGVDARIRAASGPSDVPREDVLDWAHLGPSLCCGLPYQLFADPLASPDPIIRPSP